MMLPLGGTETITRVMRRTAAATTVDEVVVATTQKERDRLLAERAREAGEAVYRGDERDVLGRVLEAATGADAEIIVRIAGDCPAVSAQIVDHAVQKLCDRDADYVSNKLDRTFPLGLDVEVFTRDSFANVEEAATDPHEREHVTVYYLDHPEAFDTYNVTSDEVFDESRYQNRTDIELVLDEAADYDYLDRIFTELPSDSPDVRSIIDHVDENGLMDMISNVTRNSEEGDTA
jgi:spore coat polysaccharide biosynthesis protein SpsF